MFLPWVRVIARCGTYGTTDNGIRGRVSVVFSKRLLEQLHGRRVTWMYSQLLRTSISGISGFNLTRTSTGCAQFGATESLSVV